ncbi:hypothetical protein ACPCJU_10595 [Streptomyces thermodiastaticus]
MTFPASHGRPPAGPTAPDRQPAAAPDGAATGPDRTATALGRPHTPAPRRGAADPVKALLHHHRDLCARAVDPLEIAAHLEAHGVTARTAARFRHRDVFSLAEEMYARVPRETDEPALLEPAAPSTRPSLRRAVLALLPGLLCAAAVAGLRLTQGPARPATAVAAVLAAALAVRALLRHGIPRRPAHPHAGTRRPRLLGRTCWLLAYAALGDGLLTVALHGGPDGWPDGTPAGPWPLATVPLPALALACAPAAWLTHRFTVRARHRLTAARDLKEFGATVRPLLLTTLAACLGTLAALLAAGGAVLHEPAAYAQGLTLGALLLLARLLTVHGFARAAAVALATAAWAEALAQASVFTARLPGCDGLGVPVDRLVAAWGPGSVPALACGSCALALLVHALCTLGRASAHAAPEAPE